MTLAVVIVISGVEIVEDQEVNLMEVAHHLGIVEVDQIVVVVVAVVPKVGIKFASFSKHF